MGLRLAVISTSEGIASGVCSLVTVRSQFMGLCLLLLAHRSRTRLQDRTAAVDRLSRRRDEQKYDTADDWRDATGPPLLRRALGGLLASKIFTISAPAV